MCVKQGEDGKSSQLLHATQPGTRGHSAPGVLTRIHPSPVLSHVVTGQVQVPKLQSSARMMSLEQQPHAGLSIVLECRGCSRGCSCASPELCPAGRGQRARLCPALQGQTAAGAAGPIARDSSSFHPAPLWQRATGCPAAEGTMGRKALIPALMDTLLLQGGADGRNWGSAYLLLSFVNRW